MRLHWRNLNEADQMVYRTTMAFLMGRLQERTTVDWAIRLKENDAVKRLALLDLINSPGSHTLTEPWGSAWRLIEESWNNPVIDDQGLTGIYNAKRRLHVGDRSGSLVTAIVDCVGPKLKIEPFSDLNIHFQKPPRRPKKVEDLFPTSLTSGKLVDLDLLNLDKLNDSFFLFSLAHGLETAVTSGLNIAHRIGWNEDRQIGQLHRVYYVKTADLADGMDEPDKFHRGLAPSVKLLHTVVSQLVDIDISKAIEFVHRWKLSDSPVHLRLWAALSRDPRVTSASEASKILLSLDNRRFWDLYDFPEIAELRAMRFSEFDLQVQRMLTARIRKLPPRNFWPRKVDANKIKVVRHNWALREMRRIGISGATLPNRDQDWLQTKTQEFPALAPMTRLDEGFRSSPKGHLIPPNPDNRYDLLAGEERLKALEASFSSERGGWEDDPARRARDWIRQQENSLVIIDDFESTSNGASFGRVWERFGWEHSTEERQGGKASQRDLQSECTRVLSLISKLPEATLRQAINGLSHWLSTWETQIIHLPEGLSAWFKIWPIAVEATNAEQPVSEHFDLNVLDYSTDDHQSTYIDTLNTPAGKLVGVFLAACPTLQENVKPFDNDDVLRMMRDAIISTTGRSGLIAMHRLIEEFPYFLAAAPEWTQENLIIPLNAADSGTKALWCAIGRRTHFSNVLKIIGDQMADRATDQRLDRDTRHSLAFSLIIECLHAFREQRQPSVPNARVQQMIRSLDDEARANGAEAIQRFVQDLSSPSEGRASPPSPEELFRSAAVPFLQKVWPQERSLATPGVSRALANLPASAKEAFADAVDAIESFLVPFECWSMFEYGLYSGQDSNPNLLIINNHEKAVALLRLLGLTVGTAEGSVIPYDLTDALNHIRMVSPKLEKDQVFRRLATAARRL
ncbi:MAG TPA: hypothetical protein DD706_04140 [Nitrospiraceae bacterium]|nr:hypothetical protein [Nitrospiraceae bacterium]